MKLQQQADQLVAKGQLIAAITEYQKLRRSFPEDQGLMNRLGDLMVQAGAHREAVAIFKVLALNLQRDGHDKKAVALLRKVLRLAPEDAEAVGQLSELLLAGGQAREAAKLQADLSDFLQRAGKVEEALGALSRAAAADPFDSALRFRLAQAYVAAGQKERAAGLYAEAAEELMTAGRAEEALRFFLASKYSVRRRGVMGPNPSATLGEKLDSARARPPWCAAARIPPNRRPTSMRVEIRCATPRVAKMRPISPDSVASIPAGRASTGSASTAAKNRARSRISSVS